MVKEEFHWEVAAGAREGQRVFRCAGPLTMGTVAAFLGAARKETAASLIIDLAKVPYIDSAGLGSLIQMYVSRQKAGSRLALVGANEQVRALFSMTKVEKLMPMYATEREAEQALA